ncbi:hypothetical protein HUW46_04446 [Amycolatopsis sp. CA-230715]|nr:hypothetical protein HUW46_04446 [Amycolatopsis sp. CA-230715]
MSAPAVLDSTSPERKPRHVPRAIEAIARNSEIPRFHVPIPFTPMLASTVIAPPSRPKKKNPVDVSLYSTTTPELLFVERRARLPRTANTAQNHFRGHDAQCDTSTSDAEHHVPARLPGATPADRSDAESDRHPGGRRPGLSASYSGIRLRRIPPYQPFSQLTPPARGSTGVPDSLDTKRVSTSGPAVSRTFVVVPPVLTTALHSPHSPLIPLFVFLKRTSFIRGPVCFRRICFGSDENALTCANADGNCVPLASQVGQNFPKLIPETYCVAPGVELRLLCHRENRKPPPKPQGLRIMPDRKIVKWG